MIIYMFLVCRMMFIYVELSQGSSRRQRGIKLCAHKLAKCVSKMQYCIIITYFVASNAVYWTSYYLRQNQFPEGALTDTEYDIYLILAMSNFLIELLLGIAFCALWKFFSKLLS